MKLQMTHNMENNAMHQVIFTKVENITTYIVDTIYETSMCATGAGMHRYAKYPNEVCLKMLHCFPYYLYNITCQTAGTTSMCSKNCYLDYQNHQPLNFHLDQTS